MDLIYKSCERILALKCLPLFCCAKYSMLEMYKHVKLHKSSSSCSTPRSLFHINFGFVQGSLLMPRTTRSILSNSSLQTYYNSFNSYLLITESTTCYVQAFSTATKDPPIEIINYFLIKHRFQNREIRTDLRGDLAHSLNFRKLLHKHKQVLLLITQESSFQNKKVE